MEGPAESFAGLYRYGMLMEVFDVSADKLTPRFVKRFYEPKLKTAYIAEEGCIDGTCSVLTTDKYIYVTYCDSPQKNVNSKFLPLLL